MNLESLPYDVFHHILLQIEDKSDLDSFCVALPNSVGKIIEENRLIVEGLYWTEIHERYLLQVSLINFKYHKSNDAADLLERVDPYNVKGYIRRKRQQHRNDYASSDSEDDMDVSGSAGGAPGGGGGGGAIGNTTSGGGGGGAGEGSSDNNVSGQDDPPPVIPKEFDEVTQRQILDIHAQIESLARIYLKTQLEKHYPGVAYRPPSATERARVIKAVYNAVTIILDRLSTMEQLDFGIRTQNGISIFGGILNLTPQIPLVEFPDIDRAVYVTLCKSWGFWDTMETMTVLEVLCKEIPIKIIEDVSGVKFWIRADMGTGWVFMCPKTGNLLYIHDPMTLIDFMFTSPTWNLAKHVQLLNCRDDTAAANNFLTEFLVDDHERDLVFTKIPTNPLPIPMIQNIHRIHLFRKVDEKLLSEKISSWERETRKHNGDQYDSPPQRRLVSSRTNGRILDLRWWDKKDRAGNWVMEEGVVISDCLWDDFRLEEWGYIFPEWAGRMSR